MKQTLSILGNSGNCIRHTVSHDSSPPCITNPTERLSAIYLSFVFIFLAEAIYSSEIQLLMMSNNNHARCNAITLSLLNNCHQIHYYSANNQFLVLREISWSTKIQLQILVWPAKTLMMNAIHYIMFPLRKSSHPLICPPYNSNFSLFCNLFLAWIHVDTYTCSQTKQIKAKTDINDNTITMLQQTLKYRGIKWFIQKDSTRKQNSNWYWKCFQLFTLSLCKYWTATMRDVHIRFL